MNVAAKELVGHAFLRFDSAAERCCLRSPVKGAAEMPLGGLEVRRVEIGAGARSGKAVLFRGTTVGARAVVGHGGFIRPVCLELTTVRPNLPTGLLLLALPAKISPSGRWLRPMNWTTHG